MRNEALVTLAVVSARHPCGAELCRRAAVAPQAPGRRNRAAQSAFARAILHALLRHSTGAAAWQIHTDDRGKPRLQDSTGQPGPAISLSHSGTWAAAAIGPPSCPLGIDIEQHRPRNHAALAAASFGPAEQQAVARGGAPEFYRIWTLREAMAKATGQGLAFAADGHDHVIPFPSGPMHLVHWPLPDLSLALAVHCPDAIPPRIERLAPEALL